MLTGMSRRIGIGDVLAHAVSQSWLIDNGPRISPGEVEPELPTSARFVPVDDGHVQGYY
jgi:hypothetical protein